MDRPLPPIHHHLCLFAMSFLLASALMASSLLAKTEFPTGAYVSGDFTVVFGADGSFLQSWLSKALTPSKRIEFLSSTNGDAMRAPPKEKGNTTGSRTQKLSALQRPMMSAPEGRKF